MANDEDNESSEGDYNSVDDFREVADNIDHAALIVPKDEEAFYVNAIDANGNSVGVFKFDLGDWGDVTGILDDSDVEYDVYEG